MECPFGVPAHTLRSGNRSGVFCTFDTNVVGCASRRASKARHKSPPSPRNHVNVSFSDTARHYLTTVISLSFDIATNQNFGSLKTKSKNKLLTIIKMTFIIQRVCACFAVFAFLIENQVIAQVPTIKDVDHAYGFMKRIHDDLKAFNTKDYEIYKNDVVVSKYLEVRDDFDRDVPNLSGSRTVKDAGISPLDNKTTFFNYEYYKYDTNRFMTRVSREDKAFGFQEGNRSNTCGVAPFTRWTSTVTTTYRINNIIVQAAKDPKRNGVDNHYVVLRASGEMTDNSCNLEKSSMTWSVPIKVGRGGYKDYVWNTKNTFVWEPSAIYTAQDLVAMDIYNCGYSELTKRQKEKVDENIANRNK